MKTLALALLLTTAAVPSFAVVSAKPAASKLSDLTESDYQFLSTNLFLNQDDDLVKNLTPAQKDAVHRLIASKLLDQNAKVDQVGQYLTNVWTAGLDKKMRTA